MAQITYEDLPQIRERHKDKKIVFASGCFDLLHAGHVLFLEDCKKHGDILVVALGKDHTVRTVKGSERPILNHHIRLKMIDSLKPVDYCFLDRPFSPDEIPPFPVEAMKLLRPDVYVMNSDASQIPLRRELANAHGAACVVLERHAPDEFEGISTSKIIEKIKRLLA